MKVIPWTADTATIVALADPETYESWCQGGFPLRAKLVETDARVVAR